MGGDAAYNSREHHARVRTSESNSFSTADDDEGEEDGNGVGNGNDSDGDGNGDGDQQVVPFERAADGGEDSMAPDESSADDPCFLCSYMAVAGSAAVREINTIYEVGALYRHRPKQLASALYNAWTNLVLIPSVARGEDIPRMTERGFRYHILYHTTNRVLIWNTELDAARKLSATLDGVIRRQARSNDMVPSILRSRIQMFSVTHKLLTTDPKRLTSREDEQTALASMMRAERGGFAFTTPQPMRALPAPPRAGGLFDG